MITHWLKILKGIWYYVLKININYPVLINTVCILVNENFGISLAIYFHCKSFYIYC